MLGPGPDTFDETDSQWAPAFFAAGWRDFGVIADFEIKISVGRGVAGWLRDLYNGENAYNAWIIDGSENLPKRDYILTVEDQIFHEFDNRGGWFYRTP